MYYDFITELQETAGTLAKRDILEIALYADNTFRKYIKYLLNPYFQAWVSNIDWSIEGQGKIEDGEMIHELIEFLEENESRSDYAVNRVEEIIASAHPNEVPALMMFIKRDIKAGVAIKSVNYVMPGLVPSFELMLAIQEKKAKITYPCYVEPKLDGARNASVIHSDYIQYKTRSGKSFGDHIEFEKELRTLVPTPLSVVVDGELMHEDFQMLMRQARRKHGGDMEGMYYAVFDMLKIDQWKSGNFTETYLERRKTLAQRFDHIGAKKDEMGFRWLGRMCLVPVKKVHNEAQLLKVYEYWYDRGFEGAMIKSDDLYEFKRSRFWVKKKSLADYDGIIVDVEQGTDDKKFADVLGAFIVDYDGVITRVGGGFNDEKRREYWDIRDEMIGKVVTVDGDSRLTDDGCIRWPIFNRFRDDIDVDEFEKSDEFMDNIEKRKKELEIEVEEENAQ